MSVPSIVTANRIALALPLALIAGALGSQYIGGLYPCEMCHWQRWPHYAAIGVATLAFVAPPATRQPMVIVAALLIAASGVIGVLHAGVEYHWWAGFTACTSGIKSTGNSADMLSQIMNQPLIRCDVPQWSLGGISLAGFNAILSLGGAIVVLALATRRRRLA